MTTTKATLNNIEQWSDKELSKEILTLEYVIRRSKERLKQLREEEHRRDNIHAYFSKDDEITRMLVNTGITRKKRNNTSTSNTNTDRAIRERQFTNSSIQGGM